MGPCQSQDSSTKDIAGPENVNPNKVKQHHFHNLNVLPAQPPAVPKQFEDTIAKQLQPLAKEQVHSEYDNKLQSLQQQHNSKAVFIDADFPAQRQSLSDDVNFLGKKDIQWKRPCQFLEPGEIKLFDNIEPMDILQGELGDCYLLSSLAALAEIPRQIQKLFITKTYQENGLYGIYICHNGIFKQVLIDDQIPCKLQGGPIFSRANGNELWVLLLEKAYAKLFGSYHRIESGLSGNALKDLTGAPYEYFIRESEASIDAQKCWEFCQKYNKQDYILTASSEVAEGKGVEFQKESGIVSQHCYAILDTQDVVGSDGRQARILQIRNPWGRKEWTGNWSDQSTLWTPQLIQKLKVEKKDDGLFWIAIEDFIKEFSQICVCKLKPDYLYSALELTPQKNVITQQVILMRVYEKSHQFISLTQKDKKHFSKGHKYGLARIIIGLIDPQSKVVKTYQGCAFDNERDIVVENDFVAGDYAIYIEVEWYQDYDRYLAVSAYGSKSVQLEELQLSHQDYNTILNGLIRLHEVFTEEEKIKIYTPDIKRLTGNVAGYLYFLYQNNSTKDTLKESISLKNRKFLEICDLDNSDQFQVDVKPHDSQLIKYRVTKDGGGTYSYGLSAQTILVEYFTDEQLTKKAHDKPDKQLTRKIEDKTIDVVVNVLNFNGGMVLLFENHTDLTYKEDAKIQLQNLKAVNCDVNRTVSLTVPPKKAQLLRFSTIDLDQPTGYNLSSTYHLG